MPAIAIPKKTENTEPTPKAKTKKEVPDTKKTNTKAKEDPADAKVASIRAKNLDLAIQQIQKDYGEGSKDKPSFPKQPDWFLDARGFKNLESGLKKVGFNTDEVNGILGNNWYNFYKGVN